MHSIVSRGIEAAVELVHRSVLAQKGFALEDGVLVDSRAEGRIENLSPVHAERPASGDCAEYGTSSHHEVAERCNDAAAESLPLQLRAGLQA